MLKSLLSFVLDLIFPVVCQSCGNEGQWLCQHCFAKLQSNLGNQVKTQKVKHFEKFWVVSDYDQELLSNILHIFKYKYVKDIGVFFSRIVADFLKAKGNYQFDCIVPVPLSKKRKLIRGYNQSEIIAQHISQELGWQLNATGLVRKIHTHSQVGLNSQQRLKNVRNIFEVKNKIDFKNKKILLVDDVITTGATMRECAKVLKQAGAKEIYGIVIFSS